MKSVPARLATQWESVHLGHKRLYAPLSSRYRIQQEQVVRVVWWNGYTSMLRGAWETGLIEQERAGCFLRMPLFLSWVPETSSSKRNPCFYIPLKIISNQRLWPVVGCQWSYLLFSPFFRIQLSKILQNNHIIFQKCPHLELLYDLP